ncbi:MAG: dihydropteroate synthase [Gammaproteobacteria bacterium]
MLDSADRHQQIMGILNLTPDSFSDGGRFNEEANALEHARQMVADGARIIDVGGESTRPGSERVSPAEQIRRIVSVIKMLRAELPAAIRISVDSTRVEVAGTALDAGANMLNDVTAGREEPAILKLAADRQVPIVLMHMQGTPATMQNNPHYENVVNEVRDFLLERARAAEQAGCQKQNIILDPGIGFGKTREHNMELMRHLGVFTDTGYDILLGTSRKRFMGSICQETVPAELVGATCATTVLGAQAGVRYFRVHDVRANRQALDVALALT